MGRKEIILIIKVMNGGGAERVLSLLANHLQKTGHAVILLITHQESQQADLRRLDNGVPVIFLEDELNGIRHDSPLSMLYARLIGKLTSIFTGNQDIGLVRRYVARNYAKTKWMQNFFRKHNHATLIAFLYDAIFLTMLSKCRSNRLIISERGDPGQSLDSKTDMAFFKTIFPKADAMVFQSPDVQQWYKENIGIDGMVIFNPITNGLPLPHTGKRCKRIVNFCRINPQKNLVVLIEAFEMLYMDYPDYELWIYGDATPGDEEYALLVKGKIKASKCASAIHLMPARADVHDVIIDSAMFVSSSDFEGMSNSMLEAMAIGLPVVCTDCPAGGARAVIRDHENGLLVPVKDTKSLYLAMKEVLENPSLAMRLSQNAIKIRNEQSEDSIMSKWLHVIEGNR